MQFRIEKDSEKEFYSDENFAVSVLRLVLASLALQTDWALAKLLQIGNCWKPDGHRLKRCENSRYTFQKASPAGLHAKYLLP